jgi:hypothetical protein
MADSPRPSCCICDIQSNAGIIPFDLLMNLKWPEDVRPIIPERKIPSTRQEPEMERDASGSIPRHRNKSQLQSDFLLLELSFGTPAGFGLLQWWLCLKGGVSFTND